MFRAVLFELDKLDRITRTGITVTAEATVGIGRRIYLHGRSFVCMEGTMQAVIPIGLQTVMIQYHSDAQLLFNGPDLHCLYSW
jgi:hypothetical protein